MDFQHPILGHIVKVLQPSDIIILNGQELIKTEIRMFIINVVVVFHLIIQRIKTTAVFQGEVSHLMIIVMMIKKTLDTIIKTNH